MNKLSVTILTILILTSTAHANGPGVTSNAFLRIGMGARAVGMGGAFCAIADDASSNYYNPAGLCGIEKQEVLFMHTQWLANVASEYIAYALPMDEDKSLGASFIFLHAEDMARNHSSQETGKFNNHDACLSLSYASKMGNLSWGLTPKLIQRQLKNESAASVGLDIGTKYINNNLSLGATIQNLGTKIKFISESSPSPLNLKLGIGYKMITENDSLTLVGDIDKPIDNDPSLSLGAEYNYANWAFARVGARIGQAKQGLSSGFGIVFHDYRFDYAFTNFDDLGLTHRAAITLLFGIPEKKSIVTEGVFSNPPNGSEEKPAVAATCQRCDLPVVTPDKPEIASVPTEPTPPVQVKEIAKKATQLPEPEILEPRIFIFPDTRIFTPDGDGTMDSVTFVLRVLMQTQINKWDLKIVTRNDKIINAFAGTGHPPEILIWDGKDTAGNLSSSGAYFCILSITDKNNKVWTSGKEIVVIE
ncbi:MAG: PorV/PorQ family protein [Candidatus Desantisbacteria bacterium]